MEHSTGTFSGAEEELIMRFLSILLAGLVLSVVGCGEAADDGASKVTPPGPVNPDTSRPGMDPKNMPVDPIKDDSGKIVDEGGKEDAPKGSKLIPQEAGSKAKEKDLAKKPAPKKAAPKKAAPKKDAPKKPAPKKKG
jgi:hypothetical protein